MRKSKRIGLIVLMLAWNVLPRPAAAAPTAPGPTTVSCAYAISDDCWVTGSFVVSVSPATGGSGALTYELCRSNDSPGGFAGCEAGMSLNSGTSFTISGTHLPSDGFRRAYYFIAHDSLGAYGPWNTPRYVRVDRYAPTVSASNASASWFSSRTATISAADATVSAGANSGLVAVRYRWNMPLDGGCTGGTATSSGTTLTAPTGDNVLYLCARDNTGWVSQWSGQYRVSAPVTAPGPTTVSCAYAISDDCWVTGDFVVSVSPATGGTGAITHELCRSNDSPGGFAGCEANVSMNSGTAFTISGTHLPSDGYRRAYYFIAHDSQGVYGPWNTPRYVRVDRYAPTVSATNASATWFSSRTATVSAGDATVSAGANSGLGAVRYSWNAALDASCTTGTATSSGATLTAPVGDNVLYLCSRDNTGRVAQWNGQYRVSAPVTAPGPTTVACNYAISDDCWVTGNFVVSVSPASGGTGALTYELCRSNDSPGGFAGCEANVSMSSGTSFTISGTHLASDGFRRAYYFIAHDTLSVYGPWNTPRYVRVDRYAPTVSATNASATWFSSRTATISAADATVSAGANSGLAAVRYSWNTALDGGCTTGTATSSGATLNAPNGDNVLYLCARDNTGRVAQWNGQYRVSPAVTAPGPTTVSCAYSIADDCWVTGDFVVSVSPATGGTGAITHELCRSVDSPGGFAGCDANVSMSSGTSFTVTGAQVPSDGFRRAYYFIAHDTLSVYGPWNTPRYVRVDRYPPTVSATNASATWYSSRTATVSAADATVSAGANSGLVAVRYSWNTALDAGCTTGTVTSSGATLTAPNGDNVLYLCARDNTGRVAQWNGQYRISVAPTAPGPTTVSCAYSIADDCWVTGDIVASVTPATGGTGSLVYEICRSNDSPGGFVGCEASLTLNGGTSITITGSDLASDGFRRAYYFLARDSAGVLGPWNTPRYVRVDRYAPTVSATNASATWFPSRTATISAADATVSAGANSGLAAVRYSWNTALDAGCTTGTVTSSGATLTAPAGDNVLYLCARDNTGRVAQWNGQYRISAAPTAPGPTTVSCAYAIADDCWVTGDFVVSVSPATGGTGALTYEICRSNDSPGGFAGCDANVSMNSGTSFTISGTHLPSDGSRRAYYFIDHDTLSVYSPWNVPRYVRVDRYAPAVSATNASSNWFPSRTATVTADDATVSAGANSGLVAVRYRWNMPLDAGCTTGTATSSGATLTAPAGDNILYLCASDNTGRVATWSGRYRVGTPSLTVTTTPSPAQSPAGTLITWKATATGGDAMTRQFALFRRHPGGAWIPSQTSPAWQSGTTLAWTPNSSQTGVWEIAIWVRDGNTLPDENTFGYSDSFDPGQVQVTAPDGFTLNLTPSATSVRQGHQAPFTISLDPDPGFTGTAALSVTGIPTGASHSLVPSSIGASASATLTVDTTTNTPLGDYTLTVTATATAGSLTRTATAQLSVTDPHPPVLNSISPDSFGNGGRVRVTVQGSFLADATVSIAQEQTDPDDPVSRVFPTAQVISINRTGTSMVVEIDATDTRILDFHNLVVDNGADIEPIQFRVLPGGPLVDAWTPSQPQVGLIHALSIAGRNLRGTTVTPSVGGRILLHSVETTDTEITALLEVLPNAPTGPMSLIVSDAAGRTVEVPITIMLPQKSTLASHNLTERKNGEKLDGGSSPLPAIWFQEFVIRDPDHTEVLAKGNSLRIHGLDSETLAKRSHKSISFDVFIHVTIPLVRVQWQKVILFDPITGAIGDAVLRGLGLGSHVPIGAFVLSAYFQIDLTIYFRLTNFGYTFPRFCLVITYGIEVTGFDGFAYKRDFCVGGGWNAFGKGSLSSGEISGGNCASVTPTSFGDGVVEGEVEQNACCSQPIGVAISGNTFTGLSFGRSFSVNNPQAGTTTPDTDCACSVELVGPLTCVPRGVTRTVQARGMPAGGTYSWAITEGGAHASLDGSTSGDTVRVKANSTSAADSDVTLEVTYTVGDDSCVAPASLTVVAVQLGLVTEERAQGSYNLPPSNWSERGLPQLGAVDPKNPQGTRGFFKNVEIKATITPCDAVCQFDFKRVRKGLSVSRWQPPSPADIVNDGCETSYCDDDFGSIDDEDLTIGPACGIYSLDTPGIVLDGPGDLCTLGDIGAYAIACQNFKESLAIDGKEELPDFPWYASTRIRCNSSPLGAQWAPHDGGTGNRFGAGEAVVCNREAVLKSASLASEATSLLAGPPLVLQPIDAARQLLSEEVEDRIAGRDALVSRLKSGDLAPAERTELISQLLAAAARVEQRPYPLLSTPLLAIELLGDLRAEEAIPILMDRLLDDFPRLLVTSEQRVTPAGQALAKIGKPAIEPLISKAAGASEEEWGMLRLSLSLIQDQKSVKAEASRQLEAGASPVAITRLKVLLEE